MADAATSWTDERVELLGKLWGEGLSASQIAALLGGGVTRNAVIGKVHRLGLSGRTKAGQPAPAARPAKARPPATAPAAPEPPRPRILAAVPVAALPAAFAPPSVPEAPPAAEAAEIPVSQRVSILELRETMCRWPLGDPQNPEFGFCGARTATGLPYCLVHCRLAYQPASERKRLRA
ncbi:GcrA family cell cycle regulator [Enterovirga sp.]|uniref:GcrA family cell cycle regulator n=1 Tax=Enterovirga sp. TaxID=2026350 RepID=UPI002D15F264|nr:GcrA family cell cycle regulator [Enterovirga sp.]HMO28013.1 GcrA family cell cycle regulator [Enterovirga sp.]